MICPHCNQPISDEEIAKHFASKGGSAKTEAKRQASRTNGKKGGRPVKKEEPAAP
jgi:hypothetical protein